MVQSLLNKYAQLSGAVRYSLAIGQLAAAVPQMVLSLVGEMLRSEAHGRYLPVCGSLAARQSVAEVFESLGISTSPEECMLGNGAKSLYSLAILAMTRPGDKVIWFSPGYPPYSRSAELLGRQASGVPCAMPLCEPDLELLEEEIAQAKSEARSAVVVVCNPSNPCGRLWGAQTLQAIVDIGQRYGAKFIADETYGDFVHSNEDFVPLATIPECSGNVLTIRSGSKELAIPGYRLGYASGPREVIDKMSSAAGDLCGCPNVLANAAATCLGNRQAVVERSMKQLAEGREVLRDWLAANSYEHTPLDAAFFAWVKLPLAEDVDGLQFADLLLDHGVGLVPGEAFVEHGAEQSVRGWFRISYAGKNDELERGLKTISSLL